MLSAPSSFQRVGGGKVLAAKKFKYIAQLSTEIDGNQIHHGIYGDPP